MAVQWRTYVGKVIAISDELWGQLAAAARRRRRAPEVVVRGLIREFLEQEEDRQLDADLGRDIQRSGYQEADAVRIVHQYRKEVRKQGARNVRESSPVYSRSRRK
jgi:hypothetical protein